MCDILISFYVQLFIQYILAIYFLLISSKLINIRYILPIEKDP